MEDNIRTRDAGGSTAAVTLKRHKVVRAKGHDSVEKTRQYMQANDESLNRNISDMIVFYSWSV
jgi:hypothetical protein